MAVTVQVRLTRETRRNHTASWMAQVASTADSARLVRLTATAQERQADAIRSLADEHLSIGLTTRCDERLQPHADVLHEHRLWGRRDAELRAADTIWRFPGCAVAAVGYLDGLVVATRTGKSVQVSRVGGHGCEAAVIGSLMHAWLATGRAAADLLTVAPAQDDYAGGRASILPARRLVSNASSDW